MVLLNVFNVNDAKELGFTVIVTTFDAASGAVDWH